ncbi:unnamed protein product [Coregonus sp. 'balchen']|nr:unnamed protein product [Coregonus sp. 'balchen']
MLYKYMHTKHALMKRGSNLNSRRECNTANRRCNGLRRTTNNSLFDTTGQSPYLFWYKQQANGKPIFMLRRDTFSPGEAATEFKDRFDARLNFTAKSVPLMIQRVQLSDSAVYFCALRSTSAQDTMFNSNHEV